MSLAGRYTLLAGDPQAKGEVVDGTGNAARFNQPRDMCQLPGSGDLLVVDGIGSSAVVRYVSIATGDLGAAHLEAQDANRRPFETAHCLR